MRGGKIGYTQGVYDLFHIGHLNLIKHAKENCDYLIVGINSDELVKTYKNKTPLYHEEERKSIVESLNFVDECIIVNSLDKLEICKSKKIDIVFIGSDWKGSQRWIKTENDLSKINCKVVYLPHTDGISSTLLSQKITK